jgi:hypothetical protein
MSDRPTLTNPLLHVVLADGAQHDVQTRNVDLLRYDLDRAAKKWSQPSESPILWQTYIAWQACRREALIDPKMPWEVFSARECVDVSVVTDVPDAGLVEPADPGTRARLMAELAVATNTMPSAWARESDEAIVTTLAVLGERADAIRDALDG